MFNEFGVPMNDIEMNMLPPGQNKLHQRMLAESGVEMNLLLAPMALSMAGSFFSGQSKRRSAKIAAAHAKAQADRAHANQAASTAYTAEWAKQSTDYYNKETTGIYDKKLDQYSKQLALNNKAGNVAFGAEMTKMEEQYKQFAFKQNDMQKELLRSAGVARASGGSGSGYSRSKARSNMINTLGEFGRANQMLSRNLMSAERASDVRKSRLELKHQQADMHAWSKVAIAPRMRFTSTGGGAVQQAPVAAMPVPGYSFGDFAGDFIGSAMSVGGLGGSMFGGSTGGGGSGYSYGDFSNSMTSSPFGG